MRRDEITGFLRLGLGLRRFLADPIRYEDVPALIAARMADRDARFMAKLARAVYGNEDSPYRILLGWAGIEQGDVETLVRERGIEGALCVLREAGVYVDWEEFKGRKPIRRGSQSIEVPWWMFNNPLSRSDFESSTGGSSGRSLRVAVDLDNDSESAPDWAALFDAHGWRDEPLIFWTPDHVGVASRFLKCSRFGKKMARWFVMARMTNSREKLKSAVIHGLVRLMAGYPRPIDAPLAVPAPVLDDLYGWLDKGHRPVVNTSPSAAATLAILARARGRPLEGVSFLLGAEPVTRARHEAITASGALPVPTYGTTEAGWIGAAFPRAGECDPAEADGVHIFKEAFAIIANGSDGEPAARPSPLLFTNLRAHAPKVLLNTEIGDSAVIATDAGDVWAQRYGFDVRLHTIRSYRKVTIWGTTLAVADLVDLVERALPARFGGTHADYQLREDEAADGRPFLRLLIAPDVGTIVDQEVIAYLLEAIAGAGPTYGYMAEEIASMQSLVIERTTPELTARGKLQPVVTRRAA